LPLARKPARRAMMAPQPGPLLQNAVSAIVLRSRDEAVQKSRRRSIHKSQALQAGLFGRRVMV
jgi:hypothetical protein